MSSELERRLEGMLAAAPEPDPGAGEEALHRALRALRPVAAPRRGLRAAVLVFAAAVVLLVIAAGSLARRRRAPRQLRHEAEAASPATTQLMLPKGANGIAAIVNGRLSVVTTRTASVCRDCRPVRPRCRRTRSTSPPGSATRSSRWPRRTPRLVPCRRREGHGDRVGAGRVANRLRGSSPARRFPYTLHVIWGNGTHDTVIDTRVLPTTPSWRADSLAFAYVGAGGKPIVYDLAHLSRRVVDVHGGDAIRLAFAPTGDALAVNTLRRTVLVGTHRKLLWRDSTHGIGWLDGRLAIAATLKDLPRGVEAFETRDRTIAVAVVEKGTIRVLAGSAGHLHVVFQTTAKRRCYKSKFLMPICAAPITDLQLG